MRSFPRRGLAGEVLTTRPVFAETNFPLTGPRSTYFLLALFRLGEFAALSDFDLEVFDAFTLRALVIAFFCIFPPRFPRY
jgi:hypothetical protein